MNSSDEKLGRSCSDKGETRRRLAERPWSRYPDFDLQLWRAIGGLHGMNEGIMQVMAKTPHPAACDGHNGEGIAPHLGADVAYTGRHAVRAEKSFVPLTPELTSTRTRAGRYRSP